MCGSVLSLQDECPCCGSEGETASSDSSGGSTHSSTHTSFVTYSKNKNVKMEQELTHSWPEGPDNLVKEDSQLFILPQYFHSYLPYVFRVLGHRGFSGDEWVKNVETDITLKKISKKIPRDQCPHSFIYYYFNKTTLLFKFFYYHYFSSLIQL